MKQISNQSNWQLPQGYEWALVDTYIYDINNKVINWNKILKVNPYLITNKQINNSMKSYNYEPRRQSN